MNCQWVLSTGAWFHCHWQAILNSTNINAHRLRDGVGKGQQEGPEVGAFVFQAEFY
jgi:hypothetical protein